MAEIKFELDPDDLDDCRTAVDISRKFRKHIMETAMRTGDVVNVRSGGETLFRVGPDGLLPNSGILYV